MAKRTASKRTMNPATGPKGRVSRRADTGTSTRVCGDVARPAAVNPAALAEAFDAFAAELNAATIPTEGGGRKVHTINGANLLSVAAARLSSMLAGTVVAGIGDGLTFDDRLMTAFESANRLLALTVKQHNERRPRFAFGDVLTAEQVESLESARRLLALRVGKWTVKGWTLRAIGKALGVQTRPAIRNHIAKLGGELREDTRQSFRVRYDRMPSGAREHFEGT